MISVVNTVAVARELNDRIVRECVSGDLSRDLTSNELWFLGELVKVTNTLALAIEELDKRSCGQ